MPISKQTRLNIALKAPIPGSSLTKEPGSMPYEKPPQFVRLDEAMHHMMGQLTTPFYLKQLLQLMEMGTSIEAIARTLLFTGFSLGKWTVDLAMLMYKPLMLLLMAIAHRANLKDTPVLLPQAVIDNHINKINTQGFTEHMKSIRAAALAPIPKTPVEAPPVEQNAPGGFMKKVV